MCEHPSSSAASCKEAGMLLLKYVRVMITLDTDSEPGMITDQAVFSMFRLLTSKYVGIMPPEKNMVNSIILEKNLPAINPGCESGKAAHIVRNRLRQITAIV